MKWLIGITVFVLALRVCLSIIGAPDRRPAIYIMKLSDTIFSSEGFIKELRGLENMKSVKAVVLRINSPGGVVGASQEIFREIESFKKKTGIKFVCSVENVGTSGAYYVSLACDRTLVLPGSIVGSIGVISLFFTVEDVLRDLKVKTYIVKSGRFKDSGSPFRQQTEEDIKYISDVVMKLFSQFKKDVVSKRPALKDMIDDIADGRVFTGEEAVKLGLVDQIGTFSDAITIAQKLAGIKEKPKIIWKEKRRIPFISDIIGEELMSILKKIAGNLLSPLFM